MSDTLDIIGVIWRQQKHWLAEVPALDLITQGKSKEDALDMAADAVNSLVPEIQAKTKWEWIEEDYFIFKLVSGNKDLLYKFIHKRLWEKRSGEG